MFKEIFSYFRKFTGLLIFTIIIGLSIQLSAKSRVIIMSDIRSSGEVDDVQSLVRFLVYSNEFDVVGLIPTTSCWVNNVNDGYDQMKAALDEYELDRVNLVKHANGWPTKSYLLSILKRGNTESDFWSFGNGLSSAGSNQIISAVDASSEPTWICIWGGANTLAQALYDVDHDSSRSAANKAAFVAKLRIRDNAGQDVAGAWICHNFPNIYWSRSTKIYKAFNIPNLKDSGDLDLPDAKGGNPNYYLDNFGGWVRNAIMNKGNLGSFYPRTQYWNEGDTCTFMPLIPTGLNDTVFTANPRLDYGSWGGRYTKNPIPNLSAEPVAKAKFETSPENMESTYYPYSMYSDIRPNDGDNDDGDTWDASAPDFYDGQNSPYTNSQWATIFRWREHYQHDFAARMDWCVASSYNQANHPPVANVNGSLNRTASPGEMIILDASNSSDPDGDNISFHWYYYKEAGTYNGSVNINSTITDQLAANTSFFVPADAQTGDEIHIILTVKDDGTPWLVRYQRVIITVQNSGPQPPIADAGADQTITLLTDSVQLDGSASYDPDGGNISDYDWAEASGPNNAVFDDPHAAVCTASGLIEGIYIFQLTVKDDEGDTGIDSVTVTVNPEPANTAPVVDAGSDQSITWPTDTVNLDSTVTDDGKPQPYTVLWSKDNGPGTVIFGDATAEDTTAQFSMPGTYVLRLTANDTELTGSDTVTITVSQQASTIKLEAEAFDGSSGVELRADGIGITSCDPGDYVVFNNIDLGNGFTTLTARVSCALKNKTADIRLDGTLGPIIGSVAIPKTNDWDTFVNVDITLTGGLGLHNVYITFNTYGSGNWDWIEFKDPVAGGGNQAPVADAGVDQIVVEPTDTALLDGSGSTDDGVITAYLWSQDPNDVHQAVLDTPNAAQCTASNLQLGVYHFQLDVTDDGTPALNGTDSMIVTVTAAATTVKIEAESYDINSSSGISLRTDGIGITDCNQNNFASYPNIDLGNGFNTLTAKIACSAKNRTGYVRTINENGPIIATFAIPNTGSSDVFEVVSVPISGTVSGSQDIFITFDVAKYGNGDWDWIEFKDPVAGGGNQPPVADAGVDQTVVEPTDTALLDGSGSTDDGVITAYLWSQDPNDVHQAVLDTPNAAQCTASNLQLGVYHFQLDVTDDGTPALNGTDSMIVTVTAAATTVKIEAESYDINSSSGISLRTDGIGITDCNQNNFASYPNIDLGNGFNTLTAKIACSAKNRTGYVRTTNENGPIIATFAIPNTGSSDVFEEVSVPISGTVSGTQDIFITFNVDKYGNGDWDWIEFKNQ